MTITGETDRETETGTLRERQRHRERDRDRETQRETETDRQTDRQTRLIHVCTPRIVKTTPRESVLFYKTIFKFRF